MGAAPDILDVLVVGAGFGGLCAAIKLKARGAHFAVVEKESDLGGTWLVNRYPGCACDVESHLYSYSFAQNPDWSRSFSSSEEIWRYLKKVAGEHDLAGHIRFSTEVSGLVYDDSAGLWRVTLAGHDVLVARSVILATGALSRPALPDIDGLDQFSGQLFHSQQWDHSDAWAGKRVAVIGTGASAIQFVPHLARRAGSLTVFQRTPPWILPKPDRRVSGFEQRLFHKLPWLQSILRGFIYVRNETRVLAFVRFPALLGIFQWVANRHIRRSIVDPALRAAVTPDYRIGCKRVLISNDYYPALAQDNVRLVTGGARSLDATGVVAQDGTHTPVDVVVLGTGFNVTNPFAPGFITGTGGRDLGEMWHDGPQAYLGTVIAGFPNLFLLAGPNTALGHNSMIYMLESQVSYVMSAIDHLQKNEGARLDVRDDVQARYNENVQASLAGSVWNTGGCTSWYKHASGRNVSLWPDYTWRFRRRTRAIRATDFDT